MTSTPLARGGRRTGRAMVIAAAVAAAIAAAALSAPSDVVAFGPARASAVTVPSPGDVRPALESELSALQEATAAAVALLEDSDGRVLDDAPRTELASTVSEVEARIADAEELLVWPTVEWEVGANDDVHTSLGEQVRSVEAAVGDWEVEQARLEAERAAVAAEAAAAAAAAASRGAAPVAAKPVGIPVESMWTSGGQAEIDACRGSVGIPEIAGYLGSAFYAAEHWSCGGSAWGGRGVGTLVDVTGHGTYRVAGVVSGLAYGANASAIPAGYAGYYQTCIGGSSSNMAVWLLERV